MHQPHNLQKVAPPMVASPGREGTVRYAEQLRDAVEIYIYSGFNPVPLPPRSKAVKIKGWKERSFDVGDFGPSANVALRHDKDIVDVDLDWPEARELASGILPQTARFGRESASPSHVIYGCPEIAKTQKFSLPASVESDARFATGEHELTVLELRAGQSTMVPPSIHPSGEQLRWTDPHNGREIALSEVGIADAQAGELRRSCGLLALLSVVIRCYPRPGTRSEVGLALSGVLVRAGYEPDEANRLTRLVAQIAGDEEAPLRGDGHAARKRLDAGQDVSGLPRLVELLALPGEVAATFAKWLGDTTPNANAIILDNDREPENLELIDAAFAGSVLPHYQRQGRRVHVTRNASTDADRGALIIREATRRVIQQDAQRLIPFVKFDARRGRFAPAQLPDRLAEMYLVKSDGWRVPELRGVRESPTLRADGTVLQLPGYDKVTGYLYDPRAEYPPVPEHPTMEDAKVALAELLHVVKDFDFASEADKSVWLASVLTNAIRPALAAAPVFGLDAPQFGAGKTLLANLSSCIVHGAPMIPRSWTAKEEENEKRLYAALLAGEHSYLADNQKEGVPFGGEAIAAVLTSDQWTARTLGKSEQTPVSTRVTFFVTGVNLTFTADLVRRAVKSRIEPQTEHPESRTFDYDVMEETRANHPHLLVAALTIARAYVEAGYPMEGKIRPMGSFSDFDRLVRSPLIWLGCADPLDTQRDIESLAPEMDAWARGLELLEAAFGAHAFQVKDVVTLLKEYHADEAAKSLLDWVWENTAPARNGAPVNTKSLGRLFMSKRGTPRGGRVLQPVQANTPAAEGKLKRDGAIWKVVPGPS